MARSCRGRKLSASGLDDILKRLFAFCMPLWNFGAAVAVFDVTGTAGSAEVWNARSWRNKREIEGLAGCGVRRPDVEHSCGTDAAH
jgi:hypothetical protein